jgi:hypothetical protein
MENDMHSTDDKHPKDTRTTTGDAHRDSVQIPGSGKAMQGEGNYEAARKFDEDERKFVESGKVDAAARAAAPRSEAERQQMLAAEREGKSRAKGEDPALTKPTPDSCNRKPGEKGKTG